MRALDWAAAGLMLKAINGDKVAARLLAAATKSSTIKAELPGIVSDLYSGAKENWFTLAAVPTGLAIYRKTVPSRTVKVPVLPLRIGA